MYFSDRTIKNMRGVNPLLIEFAYELKNKVNENNILSNLSLDFGVIEGGGVRSKELQKKYFLEGSSKTLNSNHLIGVNGYGNALDLVIWKNGSYNWSDLKSYNILIGLGNDIILHNTKFSKISHPYSWDKPHWQITHV